MRPQECCVGQSYDSAQLWCGNFHNADLAESGGEFRRLYGACIPGLAWIVLATLATRFIGICIIVYNHYGGVRYWVGEADEVRPAGSEIVACQCPAYPPPT